MIKLHNVGYLFAAFVMDSWGRRPILVFLQVRIFEKKTTVAEQKERCHLSSSLVYLALLLASCMG